MLYERKNEALAPRSVFLKRIAKNFVSVSMIFLVALAIGTVGYRFATNPHSEWLDAFHNSSMILSGMGPVIEEKFFTSGGKIFSSLYALFSGIVFVAAMGFLLSPALHRIFHKLHIEQRRE
jgi:hypothetical protein